MTLPLVTRALLDFVDDELLRAPLLFDQVAEGTLDHVRRHRPDLSTREQATASEMVQLLLGKQVQMREYFVRSLREQADAALGRKGTDAPALGGRGSRDARPTSLPLALLDEAEVAIDVEIAHTIDLIRSTAEYELRDLHTYTAALVGDMDLTRDHNPFHAEAYARALWAASQALPKSRGLQASFMHHAGEPLAMLLRQAYAASATRLEMRGIEPAAYRTLILPGGARRERSVETTFSPPLQRVRETLANDPPGQPPMAVPVLRMPEDIPRGMAPGLATTRLAPPLSPAVASARRPEREGQGGRESQELVHRLFEAIRSDTRVPADVLALIVSLKSPAMLLAQREAAQMSDDSHPMWVFVNRLAYEAEMCPDPGDPERMRLLRLARATIQQLGSEPEQRAALYTWAHERLEVFLRQRLARRCTAAASQIGALQKLEDKLLQSRSEPTTLHGTLDVSQLDTVPADLLPGGAEAPQVPQRDPSWLDAIQPGDWIRMFLQGRWVHAQLLWPGERGEILLFGDGASDATFAIRRRALLSLHEARLLKSLTRRSLMRRAAQQVQDQATQAAAG